MAQCDGSRSPCGVAADPQRAPACGGAFRCGPSTDTAAGAVHRIFPPLVHLRDQSMNFNSIIDNRALRTTSLGVLLALSVAVIAGCSGQAAENGMPPPPAVSVAPVLVKQISQWDDFSGRVEAVESVDLRPRVSGYIDRVNYEEGQEVRKGDVLFTIDSRSYRAELARAQADLARA